MPRNSIATTGRSVPEWIGKTPDSAVPAHVRIRIFERTSGLCHITKRKIRAGEKWQLDHIIPLADGGEHRESNLAPALDWAHREKTSAENKARAKTRAIKAKHFGMVKSKNPLPGGKQSKWKRKITGEIVAR